LLQVTHDISHLTCADFLRAPGTQTPVIVRFSTVIHERGSPETLRDPRGFAVKFYTREGNFDMVGNNIPVFFVRDGMKFPDMVHALKPNPKNHIQEGWRIADFFSHHPEAMHMVSPESPLAKFVSGKVMCGTERDNSCQGQLPGPISAAEQAWVQSKRRCRACMVQSMTAVHCYASL
jgi:hypothetical protein